jgi:hypothetical protein
MAEHSDPTHKDYPIGRGYGHDYMRGGEVFGGYGYSEREEYELPRGELTADLAPTSEDGGDSDAEQESVS